MPSTIKRTYERTHPWITFSLKELQRSPSAEVWGLLGECQSKCEHIAGVPLLPSVAERLHLLYLIKGIKGTTAIEGNTLSEDEIHRFLEGKLDLPPSREYLKQEVENVINGCRFVWDQLASGKVLPLSSGTLKHLNRIVLGGLKLEDDILPGEIRKYPVGVLRYRAAPAEDCEFLLDRLGDWLSGPDFAVPPSLTVAGAIAKAIIAHLYFAWIHPFGDGNGRTARLLEFYILLTSGVPTPVAHLLSNHYNLTRAEYYRQLDYASKSGGRITPFLQYAAQGLLDGLRSQIAEIRQSQIEIMWRYYVHESFRERKSPADKRKRDLVLGLSKMEHPVPISKLTEVSVQTVEQYHGKGRMTIARDVAELTQMGLIGKTGSGYLANKGIILAFLPDRAIVGQLPIPKDQSPA